MVHLIADEAAETMAYLLDLEHVPKHWFKRMFASDLDEWDVKAFLIASEAEGAR